MVCPVSCGCKIYLIRQRELIKTINVIYIYIYIYIYMCVCVCVCVCVYVCVRVSFMVFMSSLGELMKGKMLLYC